MNFRATGPEAGTAKRLVYGLSQKGIIIEDKVEAVENLPSEQEGFANLLNNMNL